MKKAPLLQAPNSAFKKACRKIRKHTMPEEEEWILETSYIKRHRLKDAAVENRQAAVKGLPKVSEEDAMKVMGIIIY